tara:strand:+ start:1612 stop:2361 length:750 start_codon:yes stop_codon:yes gene_type:complete
MAVNKAPINDTGYAPERWEFDEEVTRVFGNMIERSIPEYEAMRTSVKAVLKNYYSGTDQVRHIDLGCSHGQTIEDLLSVVPMKPHDEIIGIEVSDSMFNTAKHIMGNFYSDTEGKIEIIKHDLREGMPELAGYHTSTSVLTLMFIPIEHRYRLMQEVYNQMASGGMLVMVEKVLGDSYRVDDLLVDCYYDIKRDNGYTQEDIDRKRLSLEGVLVPLTARHNEDMLKGAGFKDVDCFWRHLNFAGWVAFK